MDIIKNDIVEDLTEWILPWVETYFATDAMGYVCRLERKDNPTFVEYFKTKDEMWDRIEEIEREAQFPSKMEVIR